MRENFEVLRAARAQGRPDWKSAVEEFTKLGITTRRGTPPTIETAKKTWAAVTRDMAKTPQPVKQQTSPRHQPPATSPDPTPSPVESTPENRQPGSKADEQIERVRAMWRSQKSKMPDPL